VIVAEKKLYDDYIKEWDGHECPLVTPYTRSIGIKDSTLEKLWRVRMHDTDDGPIPLNLGTLLREETKLKNYQTQAIAHLMLMPRLILGDAVGLGKTLSAIGGMCYHTHKDPTTKTIVFTTKSALYQWDKEVVRFSKLRSWVMRDKYKEMHGSSARLAQIEKFLSGEKKDVLVCKYTSLIGKRLRVKHYFDVNGHAVAKPAEFQGQLYNTKGEPVKHGEFEKISPEITALAALLKKHPGQIILVFDEAHKFKTTTGQLRNMILYLQPHATRAWAMTATAIKNNLDEFYSIASAIGVRPLGAISKFRDEHVLYTEQTFRNGNSKKSIRGYKNVKKFVDNIRPFFYGRSQKQVKEKLPRLQTVYHQLDLTDIQAKLLLEDIPNGDFILPPTFKKVNGEWIAKERDVSNDMTMLAVYQAVANHQALLDPSDTKAFLTKELSPKEEALLDLLDGELAEEKVIVYTKGRNWIDRLQWLTENGHFTHRKFLRITGAENEKKREDAKSKFQELDEYDLIFINNAAIEAINLQQAAHMVCLDMPWSWGDTTQLVGRMLRLASPHSACTLHVMYAAGTVDEYTIEVLKSKKGLFEKIFGASYSAGLLDDGEAQEEIDMSSGIDTVRDQSEFRDLLKAHVKPVKLLDFVSGDALHKQKHGRRETLLERGKKPKVSIEEMAAKWQ